MRLHSTIFPLLGLVLIPVQHADTAGACGFICNEEPNTFVNCFRSADFVVVGTFTNARDEDRPNIHGKTEFEIESTLKPHKAIKDLRKIVIERYLNEPKAKAKERFLLFCTVYQGRIALTRYIPVNDTREVLSYYAGALKLKERPTAERLAYCVPFLNSRNSDISRDAHREFALSDYKDHREVARKLDPKVLVDSLEDRATRPDRLGLYARLLGDCGKGPEHGNYLRKLSLDRDRNLGNGLDGMLEGYVMIEPKEGWRFLQGQVIGNSKADFPIRYCGVLTLRFLCSQRPDLVDKKTLVGAMLALAESSDVADFVIEDLRKGRRWETTDQVLALAGRKSHNVGVIQRAALRFALQSPMPQAANYVATQRKRDPDQVRETEEILELEAEAVLNGVSK